MLIFWNLYNTISESTAVTQSIRQVIMIFIETSLASLLSINPCVLISSLLSPPFLPGTGHWYKCKSHRPKVAACHGGTFVMTNHHFSLKNRWIIGVASLYNPSVWWRVMLFMFQHFYSCLPDNLKEQFHVSRCV